MITPRYSYAVRPSTMYHSSTVYEEQGVNWRPALAYDGTAGYGGTAGLRRHGWFTGPARVGHAGRRREQAVSEVGEDRPVGAAPSADEGDDEQWPFFPYSRQYPRPGRMSRQEAHEQRIAWHVQRHRQRGARPPRRDRGLSQAEIVAAA